MSDMEAGLASQDGRLRQTLKGAARWLGSLDSASLEYTQDRIERLGREIGELRREVRDLRTQIERGANASLP